jgi:spore germination protein YaaH
MRTLRVLLAMCVVMATAIWPGGPVERAGGATPSRYVTGWVPVWNGVGAASIPSAAPLMSQASPFNYEATSAGTIRMPYGTGNLGSVASALRSGGIAVIASITDGTASGAMAGILADPTSRTAHVDAIQRLVETGVGGFPYDGVDLDYEGFAFADPRSTWASTTEAWVAFVKELSARLRAMVPPRLLTVTIPPEWSVSWDYPVYAQARIIDDIDHLRLMVYDYNVSSAGPIAPASWLADVITTTRSLVGAANLHKVQIGVPTHGRSWARVVSGECPAGTDLKTVQLNMKTAAALVDSTGAVPQRHSSGEMTFSYDVTVTGVGSGVVAPDPYVPPPVVADSLVPADPGVLRPARRLRIVSCTVRRTVYYQDVEAVVARARAAITAGTGGIAVWAFGYEVPELWPALAAIAPTDA